MPSRSAGPLTQDWEPVIIHKSRPKSSTLRDPKSVNQALRSGIPVETVKKAVGGTNKRPPATAGVINPRKLDEETEPGSFNRVPSDIRLAIQKARVEKKMSQAELAKLINERLQVVQEYENGKGVVNHLVLGKIERVLGVKLRGKGGK